MNDWTKSLRTRSVPKSEAGQKPHAGIKWLQLLKYKSVGKESEAKMKSWV